MKHSARNYARAFADLSAGELKKEDETRLVKNFATLVHKNGDSAKWNAILIEASKLLREKEGRRKVTIETARPLTETGRGQLAGILQKGDIIEEKINTSLVAGVRVTVNDENQFDASLTRRLDRLFA
jgi:F0F1-type ATP synthase delta subunit